MKKYLFILTVLPLLLLYSCDRFLGIQPQDKFTEDMVYSNRSSVHQALNGIYNDMASNSLYGANLTSTTIELFAQRYRTSAAAHQYVSYQAYAYDQSNVQGTLENIWRSAYQRILALNVFIEKLNLSQNVLNTSERNILLGEASGLRALIHFDILRLYGPMYNSNDSTAISIPYNTRAQGFETSLLPANTVMDSIQHDLQLSSELLRADPIIDQGIQDDLQFDGNDFYRYRNRRMNYYAVKALQARVHLYRNQPILANRVAKEVLEEGEKWFQWITPSNIIGTSQVNPDRIFSTEVLFGLINNNMYISHNNNFASTVSESFILAPLDARLSNTFEANENDFRYTISNTWRYSGEKPYRLFAKFADVEDQSAKFRFFQPLIRKTELYYIIAETEADTQIALSYLNTVRTNRGLLALSSTTDLPGEIRKEYQKEFFGEGQLFFYYKRQNAGTIPNANALNNISMNASRYMAPLPLSETDYR